MDPQMQAWLQETGVIAIVRGVAEGDILPLADALYQGGVRLMEVTLNTPGALEMIRTLKEVYGEEMGIGAGTVMSVEEARAAKLAGAQYLVTPHVDVDLIRYGVDQGLPVFAGALTPTEIATAHQAGASLIKVFPSASVGSGYFRDLRGPFPDIPLLAVGGVNLDNAGEFLAAGAVGWGLGSSLVDKRRLAARDLAAIQTIARRFVEVYQANL
ncbi:MAG: bifunctional 4-hydroxy-2-oxoglutarate aldolase/2-dehydro-3-deoxy-phosphogluconate aldolase [Alicyclobacillus herbarius]|uniref:bifunctional 4-hydroxy-2-oxoglutarate aldolase/2-dehydro-3-deoxy-phosphogluconate aldolase n=1 Tax=Alicyclobacillus herbarius TaxID=122960 RepID=UPI0023537941|nr:bifunctional 4-hydroxy-2-oxoglutarate aldolase/2-dehydro-3-deoxy-phosphogluconate aldolase [Alicyclobacillus herbarius]MCL6633824.1 bifunctional 4-hydroxy-2-oxoglutarate aldolase/2-dehydro-3-deoxy-phosphogluconate aldolase [Alicyclobacillus herbarius]